MVSPFAHRRFHKPAHLVTQENSKNPILENSIYFYIISELILNSKNYKFIEIDQNIVLIYKNTVIENVYICNKSKKKKKPIGSFGTSDNSNK